MKLRVRLFWDDLRLAIRAIVRRPLASLPIVLSLALGIGLNAILFSFLDALYLASPSGVGNPRELVVINSQAAEVPRSLPVSYPNYLDVARQSAVLSGIAAYRPVNIGIASAEGAHLVGAELVSENFFDLLGVRMDRGRAFAGRGAELESLAVVSERFWHEHLGGDPSVPGKKVLLNDRPFIVAGVAGGGFKGLRSSSSTQVWLHVAALPKVCECSLQELQDRSAQSFRLVGRLLPGQGLESLEPELRLISHRLEAVDPSANKGQRLRSEPLVDGLGSLAKPPQIGVILLGTLLLLLALVCANIASVLLARAMARHRELAVALCLGASRSRLCRQSLLECLSLCLLGGLGGLFLSIWSRGLLSRLDLPFFDPAALDLSLDARRIGFVLILSLGATLMVAVAPVWQTSRADLMAPLRGEAQPRRLAGRRLSPLHFLVLVQVAVCTLSLAAAGLLLESLRAAWKTDLGFRTEDLLTASFDLRLLGFSEDQGRMFQRDIVDRVSDLPGIRAVTLAERPPLGGFREWLSVSPAAGEKGEMVGVLGVGARYFETLGLEISRGRGFDEADGEGGEPVVVINEALARHAFPGGDPIDRLLYVEDQPEGARVIGIVENSRFLSIDEEVQPFLYRPLSQFYRSEMALILQTVGPPAGMAEPLRRAVGEVDSRLPLTRLMTVSDAVNRSLWRARTAASLLSLVGLLALLLAMLGVYGVTAYMVLRRLREMGIRRALGARYANLLATLMTDALLTVGAGVLIGTAMSLASRKWLAGLLQGVGEHGASVFVLTAAILMGVGLIASCVPAVRILRTDPAAVLKI